MPTSRLNLLLQFLLPSSRGNGLVAVVPTKDTVLDVHVLISFASLFVCFTAEEYPLTPFPRLHASEENTRGNEHNTPFPIDWRMLKHYRVEHWDIDEGEKRDEASDDSPEEELVAPHINRPLREVALRVRLHAEEGATHINHFPRQEEGKPRKTRKRSSARAEDQLAGLAVALITSFAQLAITKAVDNENEAGQAQQRDPQAVNYHVNEEFHSEDARLQRLGWTLQDVGHRPFEAESHIGHSRCRHDDPDYLNGGERKYRQTSAVFKSEADEEGTGLCNVFGQDVEDELLDVVENPATFFDCGENRCEVIIGQYDVRCFLRHKSAWMNN